MPRLVIIISLLIYSCVGQAIGFGPIKLYSYLNEPLSAELELSSIRDVEKSSLRARLASAKDFSRAGIARPLFLTKLNFDVITVKGRTFIYVWSKLPIKHPFVDFLVELSWAEGKLVKGYTVLLDPSPEFSGQSGFKRLTPQVKSLATSQPKIVNKPKPKPKPKLKPKPKSATTKINPLYADPADLLKPEPEQVDLFEPFMLQQQQDENKKGVLGHLIEGIKDSNVASKKVANTKKVVSEIKAVEVVVPIEITAPKIVEPQDEPQELARTYSWQFWLVLAAILGIAVIIFRRFKMKNNKLAYDMITMPVDIKAMAVRPAVEPVPEVQAVPAETDVIEIVDIVDASVTQAKLELAEQYIGIDDRASAKELLEEIIASSDVTDVIVNKAKALLKELDK